MNARIRSRIDMGRRALQFSQAHSEASPGYSTTVARLEELLGRCDALSDQQKAGVSLVAAASARKRELRRLIKSGHLRHVVKIAQVAAAEVPDLAKTFVLPQRSASYLEFLSIARTIAAEAMAHREVLVKYGLAESMLDDLNVSIGRFEQALAQGMEARRTHIGASAELETAVSEVMKLVKALDGLNRVRFVGDPEQLAVWRSATNIVMRLRAQVAEAGAVEEVKPAAA